MSNNQNIEAWAIKIGMLGNVGMAILGISFALLTQSEAILLDGMFSFINLIVDFASLQVIHLVRKPDDRYYPFGYAIFEPLLNLGKGLFMLLLCLYALFSAISAVLEGGYVVKAATAFWYALIAALGCMLLALIQRRAAKKSGSPLLEVDAQSWFIDALFSGAVAIAFIIIVGLEQTPLAPFIPYADPVLVIILVTAALALPIGIIRENWFQLIGRDNEPHLQSQIRQIIQQVIPAEPLETFHLRQGRLGRLTYVQCYFLLLPEQAIQLTVSEQDRLRSVVYDAIKRQFPTLASDIIFTSDHRWIERAILPRDHGEELI